MQPRTLISLVLFALAPALLLTACGGGGSSGGGGADIPSLVILGNPHLDGWVSDSGLVFDTSTPVAGDTNLNDGYRAFDAFDLTRLPANAQIVSATLRVYQSEVLGDPYSTHGPLVADHINIGSTLDTGDYTGRNIRAAFAVLAQDATIGYKQADATERVLADLDSGRRHAAFRVRFGSLNSDNDGVRDLAVFTDAEDSDGVGFVPQLIVRYTLP